MQVLKRNGSRENVSFDKVLQRVRKASRGLAVAPDALAQQVLSQIYDGVKTSELDELTAQLAAGLFTLHPDYGTLAARISVSNHQKNTPASFSEVVKILSNQVMPATGQPTSLIHTDIIGYTEKYGAQIDAKIDHTRDYLFDYFGFKTLERSYLLKDTSMNVIERPQHMWMRVALALWGSDLTRAFETYDLLSQKFLTHATPTLFNAGTPRQQLSSCFLLSMSDDSIAGIYKTLGDCAMISKYAGGIGLHIHNVRARGSLIKGTNGMSNGIVPMLRVFNNTARYVDQCFTPDTVIYTKAGPKAIEDVGITDLVLTSGGEFKNVRQPVRHEFKGKMLEIQLKNAIYPVRVTSEHQVFALKKQAKGVNFDIIRNRLRKNLAAPEFTDARDLNESDFLVFPIPTFEEDLPRLTEEDCRFYGILLGDGYISRNVSGVCLNSETKKDTAEFISNYLEMRGVRFNEYAEGSTLRINWSTASPGFKWTKAQLYDQNNQKRVDTPFLHLPLAKIKQLVRGLLETDGCIGEKEISIELSSYPLIEAIRYLLLRLGALTSGYERNRVGQTSMNGEIHTNLPTAVLRVPRIPSIMELFPSAPKGEYFTFLRHGDNIYSRIQSISEVEYEGVVHDFEIEDPHDYVVAHLGVAHNGGGKRNGSFAMYLEPWHADVEDFLKMKIPTGSEEERARDLFYALWIPDLFMERVEADGTWTLFCPNEAPGLADVYGDKFKELYERYEAEGRGRKTVSAQKLWFHILDSQMESGTPYLLYKDAANKKSNQKNLGTIKSSNLCVAPETMILTDKGQKQIHELENQEVSVWNGDAWSKTTVRKTGVNQKLVSVLLSNGAEIHCTPYHKFLVRDSYSDKGSIKDCKRLDASQLQEGMKLAKCVLPLVEGDAAEDIPFPYTHGFFCGDGTYHNQTNGKRFPGITLYGEKKELLTHLEIRSTSGNETTQGTINCLLPTELSEKFYVPINASLRCRLEWFAGLLDADGSVAQNGDNESLQIGSINFDFLENIRFMLQTLGVHSKVAKMRDARQTMLPDGKGGRKLFDCKPLWRLLVSSSALHRLNNLGLCCKRLQITGTQPQRNAEQFVTVVSVSDLGRTDDTYCFNEPENHAGIFNGVLTGNCTEIIEYSDKDETAVCNLASLALPSFVLGDQFDFKKLMETTQVAVRNLNRVIDINFYPTVETERSNMRHRPIGVGVQGLADVFAMLKMPWESEEAAELNQKIFEHMYYAALEESCNLADVEGAYETFKGSPTSEGRIQPDLWGIVPLTEKDGSLDWANLRERTKKGIRNSLLLAPMPTASTSQILGYNECFEPFTTNLYTRRTLAGEFIVINKHLMRDLMDLGLWSEEMKQQIVARNGSIQGIPVIPADIQSRYKTSWELKQKTLIDMAAARGAFICQSQSLNLFVADPTYAKLTSMHFYAWKQGLKTGCYYLRTKTPVTAQKFTVDPRLLAALQNNKTESIDDDDDSSSYHSDDEENSVSEEAVVAETPSEATEQKRLERRALAEKLAAEYKAEVQALKAAKERGEEVCEMCSS